MKRYIDADILPKRKFVSKGPFQDMSGAYKQGWNDAIDTICKNEPSADVRENVRGEWEYDDDYIEWSCSNCGIVVEDELEKPRYNFCPYCGADMRGET